MKRLLRFCFTALFTLAAVGGAGMVFDRPSSCRGQAEVAATKLVAGQNAEGSKQRLVQTYGKLPLSFELNRMIPTEFWVGEGNSNERKFLEKVLQAGLTYIADRGYFSFGLADKILQAQAYLVSNSR